MIKFLNKIASKLAIKAHAVRTTSEDPLQKFKFRITVAGLPAGMGFQKCSGLSQEVGVAEYNEGGYDFTHKLPGQNKVGEITLEKGIYADTSMRDLLLKTLTNPNFRQTVIIEYLDRFGNTQRTYKLAEAWVSKWEGSDFDAGSNDVAIEKMTIQFEYLID